MLSSPSLTACQPTSRVPLGPFLGGGNSAPEGRSGWEAGVLQGELIGEWALFHGKLRLPGEQSKTEHFYSVQCFMGVTVQVPLAPFHFYGPGSLAGLHRP